MCNISVLKNKFLSHFETVRMFHMDPRPGRDAVKGIPNYGPEAALFFFFFILMVLQNIFGLSNYIPERKDNAFYVP